MEDFVRPRWGIGSVRSHLDIDDLALGLILFDRIVLPTPHGPHEERRFAEAGWEPAVQAVRGVQLHPLIHFVRWTDDLRARWSLGMNGWARRLGPLAYDVEGLGYLQTALTIADSSLVAQIESMDDGSVLGRPVPHAWCPATSAALAELQLPPIGPDEQPARDEPDRVEVFEAEYDVGAPDDLDDEDAEDTEGDLLPYQAMLSSRELTVPPGGDDDRLQAAAALARDPDFVAARRRVFAATFAMAAQGVPAAQIVDELAAAEAVYMGKLDEYARGGTRRVIHQILPTTASAASGLAGGPPGVAGWLVRSGLTRFLPLPEHPQGPGEGLALARRVLPYVYTESHESGEDGGADDERAQYAVAQRFVDSGLAGLEDIRRRSAQ